MLHELTSAELMEHVIYDNMSNEDALTEALEEEEDQLAESALAKARQHKRR